MKNQPAPITIRASGMAPGSLSMYICVAMNTMPKASINRGINEDFLFLVFISESMMVLLVDVYGRMFRSVID
jgi:hypothetical protein